MEPIKFKESNRELQAPKGLEEEVNPLPVWADGIQCVSCWRPTWRERLSILLFGRVWLNVMAGASQPPVSLAGRRDYFRDVLD